MDLSWQTSYHRYQRYFLDLGHFYRQKKVQAYTEIVLSILTAAFFLFFAIKPTLVTITSLIKEIKDKKTVSEKLETKINDLALAQLEYQTVQPDLELLDQALPHEPQITLLIKQLETLAARSTLNLETVRYSTVTLRGTTNQQGQVQPVAFNLSVSGSYQNLRNYLESLINLRRVIVIDGFAFKKGETSNLVLNLEGKAFFLEEK